MPSVNAEGAKQNIKQTCNQRTLPDRDDISTFLVIRWKGLAL